MKAFREAVWCRVKKFWEHYFSPHTIILNHNCQPLGGSFALWRIYSTLCLPIPFERQTFIVQRSFLWKSLFVSYRAKKTYKLVFIWNFVSAMLIFFCNCNIIWSLYFSGALVVLKLMILWILIYAWKTNIIHYIFCSMYIL